MLEIIILAFTVICFSLFMLLSWFCIKRKQRLFLVVSVTIFTSFYCFMIYLQNPYIQLITSIAFSSFYYLLVKEYSNIINAEINRKEIEKMKSSYEHFAIKKKRKE